jgi:hypothetical protein
MPILDADGSSSLSSGCPRCRLSTSPTSTVILQGHRRSVPWPRSVWFDCPTDQSVAGTSWSWSSSSLFDRAHGFARAVFTISAPCVDSRTYQIQSVKVCGIVRMPGDSRAVYWRRGVNVGCLDHRFRFDASRW